jgi:hypothetical protein
MSANSRLVRTFKRYDTNNFTDLLSIAMANIEDSLLETGAEPGADYSRLDLLREAAPFVLSMFNDGVPLKITREWHNPEGKSV